METELTPQKKSLFAYMRGLFNPEVYWLFVGSTPNQLLNIFQTGSARSIKTLKLWNMARLVGKHMQNMPKTSLKSVCMTSSIRYATVWQYWLIKKKKP